MSSHAALRHQGARRASPDQIQHVPRNSTQGVDFVPQNVAAGSPPGVQPTSVSYSYSSSYPSQSAPRHSNATAPGWPHAGSVAAMSSAAGRMQPVLYSSPANAPSSFGIPATNHDPNHPGQHTYHHLPQRPASESAVHPNSTASHHAQTPQASTGYAHAPQRPASGPMTPPTPAAPRHAPTSQTPPQTSFNVEEHVRHLVAKLLAPTQNNFQQIWRALFDNVDAEFQRTYRQLLEEQMKAVQASRAAAALYERNKTLEEQVRGLTQYNRALHEQVDRQATELAKAKTDYELTREMARKLASENTMLARVYGKMLAGQTQTPAFAEASSSSAPVPSPQPQGSATQRTMASVNLGDLPPDLMESIRQERIRHSEKLEISLARMLVEDRARFTTAPNASTNPNDAQHAPAEASQAAPANPVTATTLTAPVATLTPPPDPRPQAAPSRASLPPSVSRIASPHGARQGASPVLASATQATALSHPEPEHASASSSRAVPEGSLLLASSESPPDSVPTVKTEENTSLQLDGGQEVIDLTGILDPPSAQTLRLFGIGTDGVLEAGHLIETSLGSQGIVDSGQQHARRGEGDEQNVPMDDVQSTPAVQETSEQNESRPHGQDEGLDIVQDADDTAASLKSRSIIVEDEAPQDMPMLSDRDVDGSNPDIPLQPPTLDEDSLAAVEPQSGAGIVDLKRDRNEADNDERDDRPAIRRRLSEDLTDIPSTPFSLELTYPELPDIETPVPSSPPPRTPTAQPEAHKTPVHSPGRTATTAKLMSPSTPPTAADTGSVPRTPVPAPASPAMQVHVTPEPLSLSAVAGTSSASKTPVPVPVSPADKSRRTPVISEPAGPTAAVRASSLTSTPVRDDRSKAAQGTPSPAQTSVSASSPLEIRAVKEEPLDGGLPSSSKVAASRRPLLGISHLALAYHIGKSKYTCKLCQVRRSKGSEVPVKVFPVTANGIELSRHCEEVHPEACRMLLKMSPAQIAEMRQRTAKS